ncbi:MAG: hypothetical protein B7Y02_12540, partial [Rhodobacterales bacterium 17-64-5]
MSVRNDISGLLGFVGRDDVWRQRLQDAVAEHLMPALEEFEVDHDELAELLGELWSGVLWGCGFEDFLGRRYGDDNIVDLYLKRRGWKETVLNRAYFAPLRDTPVGLYEVSDVRPGTSMSLRNLLTDAEPVTVKEISATRSLKQWDRIAVRLVVERDHHVISGALLPFSADAMDFLFAGLRDALRLRKPDKLRLTEDQLLGCAPIFTCAWLFTELQRALSPPNPKFCNSDGDDVMFHDLRFPFAVGVTQKELAARLDRIKGIVPESPKFWNWLAPKKRRSTKAAGGMMLDSEMEGGTVLGALEVKGKALFISVNSASRAAQIEGLLMDGAGDLLKHPLTSIRAVEQMMAEERPAPFQDGADEIPPEIAMQITRDYMDKHYRETLDSPVPALGGKSPRQAVRTATGREKVIEWLKLLENRSAKRGEGRYGRARANAIPCRK